MKVDKLVSLAVVVIFIFSSIGCSLFENKPSENDIKNAVVEKLPGYREVTGIEIQALENMGTKVEPKYHSRFIVKINFIKPTYQKIGHIGGNIKSDVVRMVLAENTEIEAFGKAISTLSKEKWRTVLTSFEYAVENRGDILGKFKRPVIEDSNEHKEAQKIYKEWEQAKAEKLKRYSQGFSGKWVGTYICGQGLTGLTLNVSTSSNSIDAVFNFYKTKKSKPYVKSGSFSLNGQFSEDGSFKLKPKRWIKRPAGYGMVGMIGKINSDFNELKGKITAGCSGFELKKK